MRTIIILLTLLILPAMAAGENGSKGTDSEAILDVVVLKNAGVIKGKILKIKPGKMVEIRDQAGHIFKVKFTDIAAVTTSDEYLEIQKEILRGEDFTPPAPKSEYTTVYSVLSAVGVTDDGIMLSLSVLGGRRFSNGSFVGLGIGYSYYKDADFLPILSEFRIYFPEGRQTPFLYGQVGYFFGWRSGFAPGDAGGFQFGAGFGITHDMGKSLAWCSRAGFLVHNYHLSQGWDEKDPTRKLTTITVETGLQF